MRSFSTSFNSKIASNSYTPVVFCHYELVTYISGATAGTGTEVVTNYYWSERAITYASQAYEARIVNTSPLEQLMDQSRQAFGDMSLQISNSPTNLSGAIQSGMKCVVYLGFEDSVGVVTDAEPMFTGAIEGNIEITEDSVSFNLTDIAHTYDRQLPDLISREEFPVADPDAIGDTKPIIMGRVRDLLCRPVASGLASVLAHETEVGDTYLWLTHDVSWWADTVEGTTLGKMPLMTINTAAGDEDVRITSLEYDTSFGTWKANLETPLTKSHEMSDTLYQKYPCPFPEDSTNVSSYYAYLVADHAVQKISNVKVDGVPVIYKAFTSLTAGDLYDDHMCADWNLPEGKAYILVPTKAGGVAITGSTGLEILDTTDVEDTIIVEDGLTIEEIAHKHSGVGSDLFTWTLTYSFSAVYSSVSLLGGCTGLQITARSGSKEVVIADLPAAGGGLALSSPLIFTSTNPDIIISAKVTCGTFYYLEFAVERQDPLGVSTFDINSSGETTEFLSNLKFPEYYPSTSTGEAITGIDRSGSVLKSGAASKTGTVKLIGGNSSADIFIGQRVTCDVIGICDGTYGYVQPNEQIKKLINLYARNPILGTEGSANIVEFVNSSEMNTQFNKVYNTDTDTKVTGDIYPNMNNPTTTYLNPSPTKVLGNTDGVEGSHAIDFAITEPNRLRDIVGDMLFHSNSHLNWRNGIAYIRHASDDITVDGSISKADLIMQTTSLSRTRASDLATEVDVRYNYSPVTDYSRRFDYAEKVGKGRTYTKTRLDAIRAAGVFKKERAYDLPMASEQVTAELVAKRLYDDKAYPKFNAGISSSLKSLAYEVGDYLDVNIPIYANSLLSKGIVEKRTLQFGSAISQQADLLHFTIRESHVGGFVLATDTLTDTVSVSDGAPAFILNDANTIFKTLSDAVAISGNINVQPVTSLGDTVGITEALAFDKELRLTDTLSITDFTRKFTGILFWSTDLDESLGIVEVVTATAVDSCYEPEVYVGTDKTTIGVYE